jgi:hypothetical protein
VELNRLWAQEPSRVDKMSKDQGISVVLREASDWEHWMFYIKNKLILKKCWHAYENSKLAENKDAAQIAYAHIASAIDPSLIGAIIDTDDPKRAIELLHARLFYKSGSNYITLRNELWSMALQEGETINAFLDRLEILCKRIAANGDAITESDKKYILQKAMPAPYRIMQAQLDADAARGIIHDYYGICEAMRLHESNLKRYQSEDGESALLVERNKYSGVNTHKGSQPQQQRPRHRTDVICYRCNKQGHFKRDCKQRPYPDERALTACESTPRTSFVADTGATSHIVNSRHNMIYAQDLPGTVTGIGGKRINTTATGRLRDFPGKALLVPSAQENILSIRQLTSNGWTATFDNNLVTLRSKSGRIITGSVDNANLFRVVDTCHMVTEQDMGTKAATLWHYRLGHPSDP